VHHPDGIGKNPWKMEPVFRYANRELDKVSQKINAGTISLDDAKLEIERINRDIGPIRMKLDDGYFGTKTTTQKATMQAAESYLNNFIKNVKGTKGACRILIGKVLGGPVDTCEAIIRQDPVGSAQKLANIEDSSTAVTKVKNAATGFLNFAKRGGKFGALAAVGAAATGAVKTFMNDDPTTYLSNEDQQKNMLIDMVTGQLDDTPVEEAPIGEAYLPALGAATVAGTAVTAPSTIDAVRKGALGAKKSGITKTALKTLGKGFAASQTPLGILATEPLYLAEQIQEGDSLGEIATNPLNYFAPAFAADADRLVSRGLKSPGIAKAMRLGISPSALKTVSRRFGLPGLALSLGISGYEMFDDYRNKRGFFNEE